MQISCCRWDSLRRKSRTHWWTRSTTMWWLRTCYWTTGTPRYTFCLPTHTHSHTPAQNGCQKAHIFHLPTKYHAKQHHIYIVKLVIVTVAVNFAPFQAAVISIFEVYNNAKILKTQYSCNNTLSKALSLGLCVCVFTHTVSVSPSVVQNYALFPLSWMKDLSSLGQDVM